MALLQQGGYVATVAFGAWLIVDNRLTMGALLAITIIANRAMAPIIQLPGLMVQWAHARAALDGIDQIVVHLARPLEVRRLDELLAKARRPAEVH